MKGMKLFFKNQLSASVFLSFSVYFALAAPAKAGEDYYAILGVSKTASASEIKTAVQKKYRALHPDLNNDSSREEELKAVLAARNILLNEQSRADYDKGLPVDSRVRVPKEKTWEQLLAEAKAELRAADTSHAPFPIWGTQPNPNLGNPMKTMEDWLRFVPEARVPWDSAYSFAWELLLSARKDKEVQISLDQMTTKILKELRIRIPRELESLRDTKNVFDVTAVWGRSLPYSLENYFFYHTRYADEYVSPELKIQVMRATYRALALWLKELGAYSKKSYMWYSNNLIDELQVELKARRKSAEIARIVGDVERQESIQVLALAQQDIQAVFSSAEEKQHPQIEYRVRCEAVFSK